MIANGAMLIVEDVHTYYEHSHILQGVTLQAPAGRVTGILGRNGVGKTTLMRSIIGFTPPRSGRIAFDGEPIERLPSHVIARRGIGLVPQGRRIFPSLTVAENLQIGAVGAREGRWNLESVFALFPHLERRSANYGGQLSGGEQQMLAIARALIRDPKIILLDEPFEGLAPVIVRALVNACRELAAAGQTIVLVEQNLAATLALAQRVYIINNGHIVHEGPAQEIKAQPELLQRYLGV